MWVVTAQEDVERGEASRLASPDRDLGDGDVDIVAEAAARDGIAAGANGAVVPGDPETEVEGHLILGELPGLGVVEADDHDVAIAVLILGQPGLDADGVSPVPVFRWWTALDGEVQEVEHGGVTAAEPHDEEGGDGYGLEELLHFF